MQHCIVVNIIIWLFVPSAASKMFHRVTVNKIRNLIRSLEQLNDLPRGSRQQEEGNGAFD